MDIKDLHKQLFTLPDTPIMPVVFVGHGTPMNAIENNSFTQGWVDAVKSLPTTPKAIVCISAHWETHGTFVTAMDEPKTIHDFYGFPSELSMQNYPAKGSPELANFIVEHSDKNVIADTTWGLDHGSWSVLTHMYPKADIPVLQISIDHNKDTNWHYQFAQSLAYLRSKGVLIVGSGNIIHNLRMMSLEGDDFNAEYGYDWAYEIEHVIVKAIKNDDISALVNYRELHKDIRLAVPTLEHYIPFIYTLGMKSKTSKVSIFNDTIVAGSLDMLSLLIEG